MTDLADLDPTPPPNKYRILNLDGEFLQEVEAMELRSVREVASKNYRDGWTIVQLQPEQWVFVESHSARMA